MSQWKKLVTEVTHRAEDKFDSLRKQLGSRLGRDDGVCFALYLIKMRFFQILNLFTKGVFSKENYRIFLILANFNLISMCVSMINKLSHKPSTITSLRCFGTWVKKGYSDFYE